MPQDYELKLVSAGATPADKPWQQEIEVRGGTTLSFQVIRSWSGPAGHYNEQWSIRRGIQDVVYVHPAAQIRVRGMQSISEYADRVDQPLTLEPGDYELVFVVEGRFMGSAEIKVVPAAGAAA